MQLCRLRTGLPECRIPLCKLIPPAVPSPVSPLRAELSLTLNKESDPSGAGGKGGDDGEGREGVRPRRKDSRAPILLAHHYSRNGSCRETGARCWLPEDKPVCGHTQLRRVGFGGRALRWRTACRGGKVRGRSLPTCPWLQRSESRRGLPGHPLPTLGPWKDVV